MTSTPETTEPRIIQGGMGVGMSSWRLRKRSPPPGQLGVVSGMALDAIFARRLQAGDPGGQIRRRCPFPAAWGGRADSRLLLPPRRQAARPTARR